MELLERGALAGPCCRKQCHETLWKDPRVGLSAGSNMQLRLLRAQRLPGQDSDSTLCRTLCPGSAQNHLQPATKIGATAV